jgi:hypothetical protein
LVKHYNSGLSSTSEATLVSFGSFSRTTFQPGLSTSCAKNTCSTWRENANKSVDYGMTLSNFSSMDPYSSCFIVTLALIDVASTHYKETSQIWLQSYDRIWLRPYDRIWLQPYDRIWLQPYDRIWLQPYDRIWLKPYDRIWLDSHISFGAVILALKLLSHNHCQGKGG